MTNPTPATDSSTMGLAPNVAGALAYALGPLTGVAFLVLEKEDRFVRFHAAQAVTTGLLMIVLSVGLSVVSTILAFVPVLGWIAAMLFAFVMGFGAFVLWLVLMCKAFAGEEWEVPLAGTLARRIAPVVSPT
jgi:uncharacterized membrane protein